MVTRREFIQGLIWGVGSLGLSQCATLDRLFIGESSDFSDRVVIIGGGFSGLLCAYHLKKLKIPFVIFEARTQLGGQILTLSNHWGAKTWADLGVDHFLATDRAFNQLTDELKLKKITLAASPLWIDGQLNRQRLGPLIQKSQRLLGSLKNKNAVEALRLLSKDSAFEKILRHWSLSQYGYEPHFLPAEQLVFLNLSAPQVLIQGGMSQVIDKLTGEVFGAFSDTQLRLGYQLAKIEKGPLNNWDLVFNTVEGRRRFEAKQLILTLPPWLWSRVEGLEAFVTPPIQSIKNLTHKWIARRVTSFNQNFERFDSLNGHIQRGYKWEQRGPWGDVRSEQPVISGYNQPDPQVVATDLVRFDWAQKTHLMGRSPGPLQLNYQYQFQLPEFWHTPNQRGLAQQHLNALESLTQRAYEITQIIKTQKAT